jgi:hypothetical protein
MTLPVGCIFAGRREKFRAEKNLTCYRPDSPAKSWTSQNGNRK